VTGGIHCGHALRTDTTDEKGAVGLAKMELGENGTDLLEPDLPLKPKRPIHPRPAPNRYLLGGY